MFLHPLRRARSKQPGINVGAESSPSANDWDGVQGSPMTWEIARVAGEQPNGTFGRTSAAGSGRHSEATRVGPPPQHPTRAIAARSLTA